MRQIQQRSLSASTFFASLSHSRTAPASTGVLSWCSVGTAVAGGEGILRGLEEELEGPASALGLILPAVSGRSADAVVSCVGTLLR